ncbi:hypothetical protein DICVIV_08329 [Dictyocaulus viviparus]|uniref:Uncharacterized protein n=1 Tax=Dictyocaulus viviparus TaxID=29172 RepID=A0A0D8XLU8_DICVI|nr:hypothetical protein DICVIV_08329 [Dictyocaulus viviparus]
MDFRVRIILQIVAYSFTSKGLNSVEEIPPPLKEQVESITNSSVGSETVTSLFTRLNVTITTVPEQKSHRTIDISQHTINVSAVPAKLAVLLSSNRSGPAISQLVQFNSNTSHNEHFHARLDILQKYVILQNVSAPSVGAPEFEDRNEPDEGGKGEEDIITNVDDEANVSPPADDEAVGEGIAKEDTEPLKGKERDENQLGAMVEDAKGNAAALHTRSQLQPHIDFVQSDDSHFMMYVVLSGMLLFCFYLLYHNKKKILGLMFEGRASHHPRRSVRYRRLSQREERDKQDLAK